MKNNGGNNNHESEEFYVGESLKNVYCSKCNKKIIESSALYYENGNLLCECGGEPYAKCEVCGGKFDCKIQYLVRDKNMSEWEIGIPKTTCSEKCERINKIT